jgi:molecular chaperone GrpE
MTDKTKEQQGFDFAPGVQPASENSQAGGGARNDERSETESLRARLEETERQLAELKDKYLRVLAENENTRKRMRQQAEENVRMEREKLLRELLPVVDNLERTVAAARGGGNGKPIVEGAELVLRSMMDFLRSFGVMQISAKGERFDPALHEALDHVEAAGHEPDTVVNEHHAGYKIGDRILRPARVTVAKAPSTQAAATDRQGTAQDTEGKRRMRRADGADEGESS